MQIVHNSVIATMGKWPKNQNWKEMSNIYGQTIYNATMIVMGRESMIDMMWGDGLDIEDDGLEVLTRIDAWLWRNGHFERKMANLVMAYKEIC